ncbi:MAG: hypothetical protein QRY72_04955 [Candidatus Rhabdochlamydia sp.]
MTSRTYDVGARVNAHSEAHQLSSSAKPFKSYMEEAPSKSSSPSPLSPAQNRLMNLSNPSWESLMNQVKASQTLLGDMNTDLNTKDLKFKRSEQALLKKKLKTASSYLKSADAKLQQQTTTAESKPFLLNQLIDYVDEGQSHLSSVQKNLSSLMKKGDLLHPAEFLMVQLKLARAQQALESSSIMISKLTDGLKTMMNIQL